MIRVSDKILHKGTSRRNPLWQLYADYGSRGLRFQSPGKFCGRRPGVVITNERADREPHSTFKLKVHIVSIHCCLRGWGFAGDNPKSELFDSIVLISFFKQTATRDCLSESVLNTNIASGDVRHIGHHDTVIGKWWSQGPPPPDYKQRRNRQRYRQDRPTPAVHCTLVPVHPGQSGGGGVRRSVNLRSWATVTFCGKRKSTGFKTRNCISDPGPQELLRDIRHVTGKTICHPSKLEYSLCRVW
jgi:hypothetical protein